MREIKFEVLVDNKPFGIERLNGTDWEWMVHELNPDNGERWTKGVLSPFDKIHTVVKRQFTGLHDKNGKEIYEGDILNFPNSIFKNYLVDFSNGGFKTGCYMKMEFGEVVGNIHQDKDLLP